MKRIFLILGLFVSTAVLFAQEENNGQNDNRQCKTWLSIEHEFVKAKNYTDAYEYWLKVYEKCPGFDKAIYIDGVKIYRGLIAKEKDAAKKKEYAEKLIRIYDERIKYYPEDRAKALHYKGIYMTIYKVGTPEELYETLHEVFTQYPDQFTHPKAYLGLFRSLVAKYKKGEIALEELFSEYDLISEHLEATIDRLTKEMEELRKKKESGEITPKEEKRLKLLEKNIPATDAVFALMDKELGDLGTCSTLVPMYSKKFEENKTNAQWLKRAANRLIKKDCTDGTLFKDIVEALHKLDPSATSARYLAVRYKKAGNLTKAMQYYRQALELETDAYKKANILYAMAIIAKKQGNKPNARNLAMEALKYKPSLGSAYLLIAGLYASSANECGSTAFEKTAIYWKAAEMARKAAAVDPTLKKKALKVAAEYEKRAPSKKDVFLSGMAGKVIKFDKCWVGGSVRVPSN